MECMQLQYLMIIIQVLIFLETLMELNLYWTHQEGVFAFSSNLTSLIKCFGNKGIDLNSSTRILFHGYCSSNTCIASKSQVIAIFISQISR